MKQCLHKAQFCGRIPSSLGLEGHIPQLFQVTPNDFTIKRHFLGFRRYPLLNLVPYMTGSKPHIYLSIETRYPIKRIAIEHRHPDGSISAPEFESRNTGTFFAEPIHLKQLTEAGFHSYELTIELDNRNPYRGNLLATGRVIWADSVAQSVFILIAAGTLGGIVATLLVKLVAHIFN